MLTVGCAGFAVPATRYFKEYLFVEVQETHVATPGPGTIRRWRREAPDGFEFALLGPRKATQEGFKLNAATEEALVQLEGVAAELQSSTVVFLSPLEFPSNKANRTTIVSFAERLRKTFSRIVIDLDGKWDLAEADEFAAEAGVLFCRDPLKQGLSPRAEAYYRLPGPAGHKSRYEDPAIETLADVASGDLEQAATYVFSNVDMFSDGKRFRRVMGLE